MSVELGGDLVLRGVDLTVERGEAVAVLGASGSGKSTLLHAIAGLVPRCDGEIHVGGRSVGRSSDDGRSALRRERMGFVFQFGELVPELTLTENVALPLRLTGTRRREAGRRADALLDRLGLDGLGGRRAGEVSGGQLQRAAIARAIVHDPELVLADEPTGALDSRTAAQVLDLLLELVHERGAGLVLVTHDAGVAARTDRAVEIVDGALAPAGVDAPA